ncbi:MAG: PQQ-dependent sugar dehydrogenase [Cyclobacteriaceae bacterium]|nr:PQQ-dependent sugar dehydrogenase [Cyclobacteriaceae bacterium]
MNPTTRNSESLIPGLPHLLVSCILVFVLFGCQNPSLPPGDPANGGLFLPDDFEALVVVDSVPGKVRHLTVRENGDLFAKLKFSGNGGVAALRDNDGDGKVDLMENFADYEAEGKWSLQTGIRIHNGYLYFSSELTIYRIKLEPHKLVPTGTIEVVLQDDHPHGRHEHIAKPFTFDQAGNLYVPFGAPNNACQEPKRTPGAPGLDPCPLLVDHAGIWKFDASKINLTQKDGMKYASGIRSVVAMDWNPVDNELYVVIHGRDDLFRLFPERFSPWQSALLPSEEFVRVTEGAHFGWPYCYYDQMTGKKVLAPEYGGDGDSIGRCADYDLPEIGFPGHWAPNGLFFYQGNQFPDRYKNGAFIAFHGSTNRAPYPQSGYFLCFVPFEAGLPAGTWEVFADGFAQVDPIVNVSDAVYRPMGITMGPDGSLYISDSNHGKIWRIMFKGDKKIFGADQLAAMEARKELSHIRTPHEIEDNIQKDLVGKGEELYYLYCGACHQQNGKGASGRFPPLAGTDWVTGDKKRLIKVVLNGMEGSIEVNGETFNNVMPQHSFLNDQDMAEVLTYIRQNFGNDATEISAEEVSQVRAEFAGEVM